MNVREKYFSSYRCLKNPEYMKYNIFSVEFLGESKIFPKNAFLKFIKDSSLEDKVHEEISKYDINVCKFYYSTSGEGNRILFFEYFPGGNLSMAFEKHCEFDSRTVLRGTIDLCKALHSMHKDNYYHGAVSTENVYIRNSFYLGGFDDSGVLNINSNKKYQDIIVKNSKNNETIINHFYTDAVNLGIILLKLWCPNHKLNLSNEKTFNTIDLNKELRNIKSKGNKKLIKNIIRKLLSNNPDLDFVMQNVHVMHSNLHAHPAPSNICCVCDESFDKLIQLLGCLHFYHPKCFHSYIENLVEKSKSLNDLKCKSCDKLANYQLEIYNLPAINPKIRLKCELLFLATVDFVCPFDHECLGVKIVNEKLKINKFYCQLCKLKYCAFCRVEHSLFSSCKGLDILYSMIEKKCKINNRKL